MIKIKTWEFVYHTKMACHLVQLFVARWRTGRGERSDNNLSSQCNKSNFLSVTWCPGLAVSPNGKDRASWQLAAGALTGASRRRLWRHGGYLQRVTLYWIVIQICSRLVAVVLAAACCWRLLVAAEWWLVWQWVWQGGSNYNVCGYIIPPVLAGEHPHHCPDLQGHPLGGLYSYSVVHQGDWIHTSVWPSRWHCKSLAVGF